MLLLPGQLVLLLLVPKHAAASAAALAAVDETSRSTHPHLPPTIGQIMFILCAGLIRLLLITFVPEIYACGCHDIYLAFKMPTKIQPSAISWISEHRFAIVEFMWRTLDYRKFVRHECSLTHGRPRINPSSDAHGGLVLLPGFLKYCTFSFADHYLKQPKSCGLHTVRKNEHSLRPKQWL